MSELKSSKLQSGGKLTTAMDIPEGAQMMQIVARFLSDRARLAKYLFLLDAIGVVLVIASAAFFGTAYSSGSFAEAFFPAFLSVSAVWLLFCYLAYKGLTSPNVFGKIVFWLAVVGHFFVFPVGTAFSGVCIWLWRDLSLRAKSNAGADLVQQSIPIDDPDSPPRG